MARKKAQLTQAFSAQQVRDFTYALMQGASMTDAERTAKLPRGTAHQAVVRSDVQASLSRSGDALMLLTWAESVRQLEEHVRGGELAPALLLRIVQSLSAHMVTKAQLQHELDKSPAEMQARLGALLRKLSRMGGIEVVDDVGPEVAASDIAVEYVGAA